MAVLFLDLDEFKNDQRQLRPRRGRHDAGGGGPQHHLGAAHLRHGGAHRRRRVRRALRGRLQRGRHLAARRAGCSRRSAGRCASTASWRPSPPASAWPCRARATRRATSSCGWPTWRCTGPSSTPSSTTSSPTRRCSISVSRPAGLLAELRHAIQADELVLHYQPVVRSRRSRRRPRSAGALAAPAARDAAAARLSARRRVRRALAGR